MTRALFPGILLLAASTACLATDRPIVGAIRWDAWTGGDVTEQVERTLGPKKYHDRLPWFAEVVDHATVKIDGGGQAVMDREIEFAADAGLDYWAFLVYPKANPMSVALGQYLDSPKRQQIRFCLILHNTLMVPDDQWPMERDRAVALLRKPGYQTVLNDRPLVYAFKGGAFPFDRFSEFLVAARKQRLNPYCVYMGWNPLADFRKVQDKGFDAISAYARSGSQASFSNLAEAVEKGYWEAAAKSTVPCIPLVTTGWDKRPRRENPVSWEKEHAYHGQQVFPSRATPAEVALHLRNGISFVMRHPEICEANTVIIYAWNEYDEGGWLAATRGADGTPDTGRLDAIGDVLAKPTAAQQPPATDGAIPVALEAIAEAGEGTRFAARGVTAPERQDPEEYGLWKKPSVVVSFDLLPTTMEFYLPCYPCQVTQNGIKHSTWWAETYDLRISGGSFEPLMDRKHEYARMWIESQNEARIVVRVRGALCDNRGRIAHADIPSGSPYGKGDWVDEWYYIYPDGGNARHVKIYTGLASRSRPFGIDRDPPKVVHEFGETAIMGRQGRHPTDDIETNAVTVVRMVDDHPNRYLGKGQSRSISYRPYPRGFGQFRDANIMLVNVKAEYKPFTIGLPYGCRASPYMAKVDPEDVFKFWGRPEGYSAALGHMVNFFHYRRTANTLEQVYLSGMTNAANPVPGVVALAWSWIAHPHLRMGGLESWRYDLTYDKAQRAWIVPRKRKGPARIEFSLEEDEDITEFGAAMWIVNPTFVVPDWGKSEVSLSANGRLLRRGTDYRVGYETKDAGTNLVLWVRMESQENAKFVVAPMTEL